MSIGSILGRALMGESGEAALVRDVEQIAHTNRLATRTVWEMLSVHPQAPEWMRDFAFERIQREKANVESFLKALDATLNQ